MKEINYLCRGILGFVLVFFLLSCGEGDEVSVSNLKGESNLREKGETVQLPASGFVSDAGNSSDAGELIEAGFQSPAESEPGRIRGAVDVSRVGVEYFLPNAEYVSPEIPSGDEGLEIVDYGPRGRLPIENSRPVVYVMFNQAMVPLARLNEPTRESGIMSMEPAVAGIYRWYGSKTLGFTPDEALLGHPRFEFRVGSGARALSGRELGEEFTFDLLPESMKIVSVSCGRDGSFRPYNIPGASARYIVIEFNQDVEPGFVSEYLEVKLGGRKKGFRIERPDYPSELKSRIPRAVLLVLDDLPPDNSILRIKLARGARPRKNYPETKEISLFRVKTIRPFRVEKVGIQQRVQSGEEKKRHFVSIEFSHRLAEELDGGSVKLTLEGKPVEGEDMVVNYHNLGLYVSDMKPGQTLAVESVAGVRDKNGRRPEAGQVSVKVPRPPASIDFPGSRSGLRHLEVQFGGKVGWSFRNLNSFALGLKGRSNFFDHRKFDYSSLRSFLDIMRFPKDEKVFRVLDISKYLNDEGYGTVFMDYEAFRDPQVFWPWRYKAKKQDDLVAVQVTDLGMTVRTAYNRVLVWVNRLSDGAPVSDAMVSFFNDGKKRIHKAVSNEEGLAVIDLPKGELSRHFSPVFDDDDKYHRNQYYVQAEKGADSAEMELDNYNNTYRHGIYYRSVDLHEVEDSRHRVYMFTDRKLYKAGEELAFRGMSWEQNPGAMSPYRGSYSININGGHEGNVLWRSKGRTTKTGGFFHTFKLPKELEPQEYRISYRVGEESFHEYFQVAAFRRGTFSVDASFRSPHYYLGDELEADFAASYLSGGPLQNSNYHYFWTRRPVEFRPPGTQWKYWTFGASGYNRSKSISSGDSTLTGEGRAVLKQISREHEIAGQTYRYTVDARVENIDRQTVSRATSVLVHPARYYLAARLRQQGSPKKWFRFVPVDRELTLDVRLADVEGRETREDGKMEWGLIRGRWKSSRREGLYGRLQLNWEYVQESLWTRENALRDGRAAMPFTVEEPGSYTLFAEYTDADGRLTRTEIDFYATGSRWVQQASRNPSDIKLTVEEELYQPGDTARILMESPIPEGRYLLTVEREGIISEKVIELEGSKQLLEVPIETEYAPVFYVTLSSYTHRTEIQTDYYKPDLGRPRYLFGITQVNVSTVPFELDVKVDSVQDVYVPGSEAEISVQVTRNGVPVQGAELAVLATDRGVVDLVDYHVPNPLERFYARGNFPLGVIGDDSRRLLLRPVTYEVSDIPGGSKASAMYQDEDGVNTRKNFNPLAFFEPFLKTDSDGEVVFKAKLPDTLTRYRLTAVAAKDVKLGYDENEFEVSNPIDVHASLPRRFRSRDMSLTGVIISNKTDRDQKMRVSVESDILKVGDESEKSIVVPKKSVYELPFTLVAGKKGEGSIRFTVRSDALNEVLEKPVIVEEPLVVEAVTTVGIATGENPEREGVVIPGDAIQGYGSLALEINTTLRPYVSGYLKSIRNIRYPSYADKLYMLMADLLDGGGVNNANAVFKELSSLQSDGLHYKMEWASSWFLSALAVQVAVQVSERERGFQNSLDMRKLYWYLLDRFEKARGNNEVSFMASWTAKILAENDMLARRDMAWLVEAEDAVGLAGYSFLSAAHMAMGEKRVARQLYERSLNFLKIGTGSVDILETYEVKDYFSSREIELALLLERMLAMDGASESVLRLMMTLNSMKNRRRFSSAFDSYWVVNAFLSVLDKKDKTKNQDFRVNVGDREILRSSGVAEREFSLAEEPLADLPREELLPLLVEGKGEGDVVYAATLSYAIPNELVRSRDEGVEVFRRYESLDGKVLDPQNLAAGETIRVRVTLNTLQRRGFLKLTVPLPSGAEIVDSSFITSGSYEDQGGTDSEEWTRETVYGDTSDFDGDGYAVFSPGDWGFWFYRPVRRIYDNAVTYLWEDFYAGQREVSFLIRTTSPGVYPTPPVSVSLQFEPEVFGRGNGELVLIKRED